MKRIVRVFVFIMIVSALFCYPAKKAEAKKYNGEYHVNDGKVRFSGNKLHIKGYLRKGYDHNPSYNKYINKKFPILKKAKYYIIYDPDTYDSPQTKRVSKKKIKRYLKKGDWTSVWITFKKGKVRKLELD